MKTLFVFNLYFICICIIFVFVFLYLYFEEASGKQRNAFRYSLLPHLNVKQLMPLPKSDPTTDSLLLSNTVNLCVAGITKHFD